MKSLRSWEVLARRFHCSLSTMRGFLVHRGDLSGQTFSHPVNSDVLVHKAENRFDRTGTTLYTIANAGTCAVAASADALSKPFRLFRSW